MLTIYRFIFKNAALKKLAWHKIISCQNAASPLTFKFLGEFIKYLANFSLRFVFS
ncbi:hypothetical protein NEOC65_001366 [Neochlamydia sp. AcF65]|nr:hypothetical protein [Neochlamydia sp. AcF65]